MTAPLTRMLAARLAGDTNRPAAQVIVEDVWQSVIDGTLDSGERLPTARELAIALNVAPRVIDRAYEELERRGVLSSRPGEGTFVGVAPPSQEERERHHRLAEIARDAVRRARGIGFDVDDLIDAVGDWRGITEED